MVQVPAGTCLRSMVLTVSQGIRLAPRARPESEGGAVRGWIRNSYAHKKAAGRAIQELSTCKALGIPRSFAIANRSPKLPPPVKPYSKANLQLRLPRMQPYFCQAGLVQQASRSAYRKRVTVAPKRLAAGSWPELASARDWQAIRRVVFT